MRELTVTWILDSQPISMCTYFSNEVIWQSQVDIHFREDVIVEWPNHQLMRVMVINHNVLFKQDSLKKNVHTLICYI